MTQVIKNGDQKSNQRECNGCDWKGETNRMLGSIGPLCPECGETTEAYPAPNDQKCAASPAGWHCTRAAGHDGPCAARAIQEVAEFDFSQSAPSSTPERAPTSTERAPAANAGGLPRFDVQSIDTAEFRKLCDAYRCASQNELEDAYQAIYEHVDEATADLAHAWQDHINSAAKPSADAGIQALAPVISSYDIEKVKSLKWKFIDSMIHSGIQYRTCGGISAVLNQIIDDSEAAAKGDRAPVTSAGELDPVAAIVRDVCELDYSGEFNEEKMLAVTVDDLRLICARHIVGDDRTAAVGAVAIPAGKVETDIARRLREKARQPFGPDDFALLTAAADECDRFYNGMMAWKQTAQKKDDQRTAGVNVNPPPHYPKPPAPQAPPAANRAAAKGSDGQGGAA